MPQGDILGFAPRFDLRAKRATEWALRARSGRAIIRGRCRLWGRIRLFDDRMRGIDCPGVNLPFV
jgi:hypothetical protein